MRVVRCGSCTSCGLRRCAVKRLSAEPASTACVRLGRESVPRCMWAQNYEDGGKVHASTPPSSAAAPAIDETHKATTAALPGSVAPVLATRTTKRGVAARDASAQGRRAQYLERA